MQERLTDERFWRTYWSRRPDLIRTVPRGILFSEIFDTVLAEHRVRSALELGGFPGHYCVFLEKYFDVETTLVDFVIDEQVIDGLRRVNGLGPDRPIVVEEDLSTWKPVGTYDLVFSLGLIEHFEDTERIIARHASALNEGGVLLICLPNFRGVNGVIQRVFDRDNYVRHNIACMDPERLSRLSRAQGLRDVRCGYHMKFGVWVEDPERRSLATRLAVAAVQFLGKAFFRLIPVTTRLGSPYIFLTARRDSSRPGEAPNEG